MSSLAIENDFKASHVKDFQELNILWYRFGITFCIKEKLTVSLEKYNIIHIN